MEELTLCSELDRQLKAVRRGESAVIVCPWCGSISNSESDECCVELADAKERLGESHLKRLVSQFEGVRAGLRDSVQCPYCDQINRRENLESPAHWKRPNVSPYCCNSMDHAAVAITQRIMTQLQIDKLHRIQDGIAKASVN